MKVNLKNEKPKKKNMKQEWELKSSWCAQVLKPQFGLPPKPQKKVSCWIIITLSFSELSFQAMPGRVWSQE